MAAPAASDRHRPHDLVHLITGRPLYTTCASAEEIQAANGLLHRQALPLRYVPRPLQLCRHR